MKEFSQTGVEKCELPPRAPNKPNTEQGLYEKFSVRRTDGSDARGGKHDGCKYFVLDATHDPFAGAALTAYANAAEATHPQLAADMRGEYGLATQPEPAMLRVKMREEVSNG